MNLGTESWQQSPEKHWLLSHFTKCLDSNLQRVGGAKANNSRLPFPPKTWHCPCSIDIHGDCSLKRQNRPWREKSAPEPGNLGCHLISATNCHKIESESLSSVSFSLYNGKWRSWSSHVPVHFPPECVILGVLCRGHSQCIPRRAVRL